jgi:predicted esterase
MRCSIFWLLALMPAASVLFAYEQREAPTLPAPPGVLVGAQKPPPSPQSKPIPPLAMPVPPAPPAKYKGDDLEGQEDQLLETMAETAKRRKDYEGAAIYQYWHVKKSDSGHYKLACYLARSGKIDAAFYWLQKAAAEERFSLARAEGDEDLTKLRTDERWQKISTYLDQCEEHFWTNPTRITILKVPKGYQKGRPIAAVIWMHGVRSWPGDFVNEDSQAFADQLDIALIGVSGSSQLGTRIFHWGGFRSDTLKRIREALNEVADRVTLKKGCLIAFGFSQGAQSALELAVDQPEEYAGSIVLSPGSYSALDSIKPSPLLKQRGFVIAYGEEEAKGILELSKEDGDWLRKANAQLIYKPYPNQAEHTFPQDFAERFPEWVKFVLKTSGN